MRFTEFKIFSHEFLGSRRLTFEPGLNLIYGGNGAGKSCTCELITERMFLPKDKLEKRSSLILDYVVEDEAGADPIHKALYTYAPGLTRNDYKAMYSIDGTAMRNHDLLAKNGSWGKLILDLTSGQVDLSAYIEQLKAQLSGLYTSGKSTKPKINALTERISQQIIEQNQAIHDVNYTQYARLNRGLEETSALLLSLRNKKEALSEERDRLQQHLHSPAQLKKYDEHQSALDSCGFDVQILDGMLLDSLAECLTKAVTARDGLSKLEQELDQSRQFWTQDFDVEQAERLLPQWDALHTKQAQLISLVREHDGKCDAANALKQTLADKLLSDFGYKLIDISLLVELVLNHHAAMGQIRDTYTQMMRQREEAERHAKQIDQTNQQIQTLELHRCSLGPRFDCQSAKVQLTLLKTKLTGLRQLESKQESAFVETRTALKVLTNSEALSDIFPNPDEVPFQSDIQRLLDRRADAINHRNRIVERIKKAQQDIVQAEDRHREQKKSTRTEHSTNDILRKRIDRDRAFQEFIDIATKQPGTLRDSPQLNRFHALIVALDQIVDTILANVASYEALRLIEIQIDDLKSEIPQAEEELKQIDEQGKEIAQEWQKLWQGYAFQTPDIRSYTDWATRFESYKRCYQKNLELQREGDQLRRDIELACNELVRQTGIEMQVPLEDFLNSVQPYVQSQVDAERDREQLDTKIALLKTNLQNLQVNTVTALPDMDLNAFVTTQAKQMPEFITCENFPLWLKHEDSIWQIIRDIQSTNRVLEADRVRMDAIQQELNTLIQQLPDASIKNYASRSSMDVEQVFLKLDEYFDQQQKQLLSIKDTKRIQAKIDSIQAELNAITQQWEAYDQLLSRQLPPLRDADRARRYIEHLRQLYQRRNDNEDLEKQFGANLQKARDVVGTKSKTELEIAIKQLEADNSEINQEIDEAVEKLRNLKQNLSSISGQKSLIQLNQELTENMAQLSQLLLEALSLMGALAILDQASRLAEANNAAEAVLQNASHYVKLLTNGTVVDIDLKGEPSMGQELNAIVIDTSGRPKEISLEHLSEGTCDQVWLALRFGYVKHCLDKGRKPLPLMFDDVLVNFDNDRAQGTLKILAEFSRYTQVILFTHHSHLLTLAERAGIDHHVVCLPRPRANMPRQIDEQIEFATMEDDDKPDNTLVEDKWDEHESIDETEQAIIDALNASDEGLTKKRIREFISNSQLHPFVDGAIAMMHARGEIRLEGRKYKLTESLTQRFSPNASLTHI